MKGVTFLIAASVFSFLLNSCNTTEPPPPPDGEKPTLELSLEDVSCTEAWIELKTSNLQLPTTVILKQINPTSDTTSRILNLNTQDSVLYIDSLLPNQTYKYQASSIENPATSDELNVTSIDTTSHDFTWQTWTFGEHSNSALYDVAIMNENNILAVGEIYLNDSLGQPDPTPYNAVYWNGTTWKVKRIPTKTFSGTTVSSQIRTIFAFSENDIWTFSIAGSYSYWNGSNWETEFVSERDGSGNKLWGASSANLYLVCTNGGITHYNGTNWQRILSGADVDLLDVWGTPDGRIVWASGKDLNKTVLIKIENNQTNIVFEDHYPWQIQEGRISGGISSIWTNNKNFIYISTPITIYRSLSTTSGEGKEIYLDDDFLNGGTIRIRGNTGNDIITSGSNCSILHYNGFSWKRYEQFTDINTKLWSSDIRGNIMTAVGDKLENIFYYKAIIIVGYK